ncbi:MAG TPA: hypothetical protein V6D35_16880 [Candidatus Sericytochromatia bacterium]
MRARFFSTIDYPLPEWGDVVRQDVGYAIAPTNLFPTPLKRACCFIS